MEEEKFRGNENWLEEYLPLKWGGLRVFLWFLVYLLGVFITVVSSFNRTAILSEEHPAVIAIIILSITLSAMVTVLGTLIFLKSPTSFPWLRKYWRNNVIGVELRFNGISTRKINVFVNEGREFFIIREEEKRETTDDDEHGQLQVSFVIHCGGWWPKDRDNRFREPPSAKSFDFSKALTRRDPLFPVFVEYWTKEILGFSTIFDAIDFLTLWNGYPHEMRHRINVLTPQETELEKCQELIREKDMHISEFGRHMFNLYQAIALAINDSSRLATNRESSILLRNILNSGIEMQSELHHEFDHNPLKVDPHTNVYLKEILRICNDYLSVLNQVAKSKEQKNKPKTIEPTADTPPAPQDPPT